MRKPYWLLLLSLIGLLPQFSFANTNAKQSLAKITHQLQALRDNQSKDRATRDDTLERIKQTDLTINRIHLDLQALEKQSEEKAKAREQLINEKIKLVAKEDEEQKLLIKQLTLHYQLGKYPHIKLLLNQQDPAITSRLLVYLNYLNKARAKTLRSLMHTREAIEQKEIAIEESLETLEAIAKERKKQERSLISEKSKQASLVHHLNQSLVSRRGEIEEIERDKARLTELVQQLEKQAFRAGQKQFQRMQHQLAWPVRGQLVNHFKQAKDGITFHGLIFKAKEGKSIRAIFQGQVAFSGWLNGYGLILIINHGHGYMSLYANNQALYRQRGELVEAGDVIAKLGHSGGQLEDGLYFEIRHNGRPLNPSDWLKRKNT